MQMNGIIKKKLSQTGLNLLKIIGEFTYNQV